MRRSTAKILTTHVGALPGPLETWEGRAGDAALRCRRPRRRRRAARRRHRHRQRRRAHERRQLGHVHQLAAVGVRRACRPRARSRCCARARTGRSSTTSTRRRWPAARCSSRRRARPCKRRGFATGCAASRFEYTGQEALQREIELLKSALGSHPVGDAFLTSTAPASVEVGPQERVLQERRGVRLRARRRAEGRVRDDRARPACSCRSTTRGCRRSGTASASRWGSTAYQRYCMLRVEALNHALANVPRGAGALPPLLGQLARPAQARHPARRPRRRHARRQGAGVSVRGGERAPRARVHAVGAREAARRQDPRARRRHARDADRRASRARLAAHPALRAPRRARERHRLDGLRARAALPSADRVGEARSARAKAPPSRAALACA